MTSRMIYDYDEDRMTKMMMMISKKVKRGWVAVGVDVRIYRHDLLRAASHHHLITFT